MRRPDADARATATRGCKVAATLVDALVNAAELGDAELEQAVRARTARLAADALALEGQREGLAQGARDLAEERQTGRDGDAAPVAGGFG